MDFRLGERSEVFRAEVRQFLADVFTDDMRQRLHQTGVYFDPKFHSALEARGWLAPDWPVELGGQGRDPLEIQALAEEFQRAGAPTFANIMTMMIANVILRAGTDEQKREILPKAIAGEILIVLGLTEPESGSDVAAARTRAVRDGDQWVIDGQKMFTTNAQDADYVFMLTRTNPDVPKHRGLTTFLVPLRHEGVEIRPVITVSGERTNITFYTGVRITDGMRVGEVDGGWDMMALCLTFERSGAYGGESHRLLTMMEHWARNSTRPDGHRPAEDPDVRVRLGRAAAENEVSLLLSRRAAWILASGGLPGVEGSMGKLFSSEALLRQSADFIDLIGPDALRSMSEPTAVEGGEVEHALRFSLGTTTYGGTSEIQRNIIAQRGLGLPRPGRTAVAPGGRS